MVSIRELSTNKGIIYCESKVRADRSRRFSRSVGTSLGWMVIDMASNISPRTGLLIPFEGPAKVYTLEENIDNTSFG